MAIPPATAYETDVNTLRERINYLRGDNEILRERVATLEAIAHSDDGAGGDGMRLFLENVAMKQRVAELLAYNQTRTDELAASVAQVAALKVELDAMRHLAAQQAGSHWTSFHHACQPFTCSMTSLHWT